MTKNNDPKTLAQLITCLSILENDTAMLCTALSSKIPLPLVKSLLRSIANDSLKHSTLLKGVAKSIAEIKDNFRYCEKKGGEVWRYVAEYSKEIASKEKFTEEEMSQLSEKLAFFESAMGEEYYVFVQIKTLQLMMKEINKIYNIDLGNLKNIFIQIINDEEHHREILETIKSIFNRHPEPQNTPLVKYQNPDAWSRPLHQTT